MRDLLLCVFLLGGLPVALARPFYGALIFTWLGLMNPHRFTYGYAYDQPWSLMYAGATVLGMLLVQRTQLIDSLKRYWPVALYVLWMGITTLFAAQPEEASFRFQQVLKVHVMCLLTLAMLTSRKRVLWFSAVFIGSIAFFGVKGGVFTILGGGEDLVWGPPGTAIADNNHLAAGLIVVLPLLFWAFNAVKRRLHKLALLGAQMLVAISILGSHSRGALLALATMTLFLVAKGKHKLASVVVMVVVALVAAVLMPSKYWERMETISTYDEDASAMGRINTWQTAIRIANAHLTGAGYEYYGGWIYKQYAPNPEDIHSSHSIYFQALGEHGWIGLGLYLTFLLTFWLSCRRLIRGVSTSPQDIHNPVLGRMLQVSLIGFMVGGVFVNIGNWDGIFYAFTISLAMNRIQEQQQQVPATTKRAVRFGPGPSIGRSRA